MKSYKLPVGYNYLGKYVKTKDELKARREELEAMNYTDNYNYHMDRYVSTRALIIEEYWNIYSKILKKSYAYDMFRAFKKLFEQEKIELISMDDSKIILKKC